eukprot:469898-Hanusia_phi.AAC.3
MYYIHLNPKKNFTLLPPRPRPSALCRLSPFLLQQRRLRDCQGESGEFMGGGDFSSSLVPAAGGR